jgi:hypothetical protein
MNSMGLNPPQTSPPLRKFAGSKTHALKSHIFVMCDCLELMASSDDGGVDGTDVEVEVTGVQHQPKSKLTRLAV